MGAPQEAETVMETDAGPGETGTAAAVEQQQQQPVEVVAAATAEAAQSKAGKKNFRIPKKNLAQGMEAAINEAAAEPRRPASPTDSSLSGGGASAFSADSSVHARVSSECISECGCCAPQPSRLVPTPGFCRNTEKP